MTKKKHIIIDGLNLQKGGGATVIERLADAFAEYGYCVTLLVARDFLNGSSRIERFRVRIIPQVSGVLRAIMFRHFKLSQLCEELGGDFILSINYHSPVKLPQVTYYINIIPFLSFRDRVKFVGVLRAIFQTTYAKRALKKSNLNVFESRYILDLARKTAPINNPKVSYIGTDTSPVKCSEKQSLRNDIVMITSGQKHKRNGMALEIVRKAIEKDAALRLVIIGNSDSILNGMSAEDRHWVTDNPAVRLTGYMDRRELFEVLCSAYALISCSEIESFYMVAIEAMRVGCPVLLSNKSSASESVGSIGFLFDDDKMDNAVLRLLELRKPELWQKQSELSKEWAKKFVSSDCTDHLVGIVSKSFGCNLEAE